MNGDKKVILHLVFDTVIFDHTSRNFDKLEGYENIYLYRSYGETIKFSCIQHPEKVIIAKNKKEWGDIISDPKNDIIYIHTLSGNILEAVNYFRDDVIVVWWCYGRAIYENCWRRAPIWPMKIYKKKTFWFNQKVWKKKKSLISNNLSYFFPKIYDYLMEKTTSKENRENYKHMIARLDYVRTTFPMEYDEMKKRLKNFHAKHLNNYTLATIRSQPIFHTRNQNILIEHSAMITNNHLDVFHALRKMDLTNRELYIPVSYGDEYMKEKLQQFKNYNGSKTNFLEKAIPVAEYAKLICSCSHAIFGVIRQAGVGNVTHCLLRGVKIFFFKDSIVYKHYKGLGFKVFTIEDDLTQESLETPLSDEDVVYNLNHYRELRCTSHGSAAEQFDKIIEGGRVR